MKSVKDMSPAEYKTAKQDAIRGKMPDRPAAVKNDGTAFDQVASHIRAMSRAELDVFRKTYGVSITIDQPT